MNICHVDPACGLSIPPKNWGAIEKIIWEFEVNQNKLGHQSIHRLGGHIHKNEFDIVHCHVANLAVDLKNRGDSGFKFLYNAARKIKNLVAITLLNNHRDPIVDDLIDKYEEEEAKRSRKK